MNRTNVPLDLIVLSDLGCAPSGSLQPVRVDRDSLDDFLRRSSPGLGVASGGASSRLVFSDFRSFRPEGIARQLHGTAPLLELRRRVVARGISSRAELRAVLKEIGAPPEWTEALDRLPLAGAAEAPDRSPPRAPSPSSPRPSDDAVENVLELVDAPRAGSREALASEASETLDRLIGDLLGPQPPGVSSASTGRAVDLLDRVIGGNVRAVLRDDRFRELEASWLALRFLVRRLDFRTGVRLHVVCADRTLATRFVEESLPGIAETARGEGRVALVLCDCGLDDSREDLALLTRMSDAAGRVRLPLVVAGHASPLATRAPEGTEPADSEADAAAARETLRTLRATDGARWVTRAGNRFLLREPYGPDADAVREFQFEENPPEAEASYAWGRAAWILGALVADSFARTGWGVDCVGVGDGGTLEDLPVRPLRLSSGELAQTPLEVLPSDQTVLQLSRDGWAVLAGRRNSDAVSLASAPVLREPAGGATAAEARRASLPFALMA